MIERDNVRATLEWADKTNVEAGLYIAGRLNAFWEGYDVREGERWLEQFIQKPESRILPSCKGKGFVSTGVVFKLV